MWLWKGTEKLWTWLGLAGLNTHPTDVTSPSLDLLRGCNRDRNADDLNEKRSPNSCQHLSQSPLLTACIICISPECPSRPQRERDKAFSPMNWVQTTACLVSFYHWGKRILRKTERHQWTNSAGAGDQLFLCVSYSSSWIVSFPSCRCHETAGSFCAVLLNCFLCQGPLPGKDSTGIWGRTK